MYNFAFLATLFKSFASIAEKQVLTKEDSEIYAAGLSFVMAFISIPLFFVVKSFEITFSGFLFIYCLSICSLISSVTAAYVIKRLDVSESAALFALSPIFVTIMAMAFLRESLSSFQLMGILISSIGIFILEKHSKHKHAGNITHIGTVPHEKAALISELGQKKSTVYKFFLIAILFFSIVTIGDKVVVRNFSIDPFLYLLIIQFFILINFTILDIFIYKKDRKKLLNKELFVRKSFRLNILLILAHRIAHMLALPLMQVSVLNAIKQLAAVVSTIVGGTFFFEKHLIRRTIACLCIVGGVLLVVLK